MVVMVAAMSMTLLTATPRAGAGAFDVVSLNAVSIAALNPLTIFLLGLGSIARVLEFIVARLGSTITRGLSVYIVKIGQAR
jgi:ketopantoate hydroxymethyltransferase